MVLVRGYQLTLSYWLGRQCRFEPSCSYYSIEAYKKHGGIIGSWLTLKRLLRCHPFSKGGIDNVPEQYGCGLCQSLTKTSNPTSNNTSATTTTTNTNDIL